MTDVVRGWLSFSSSAKRQRTDVAAIRAGEERLVRCYLRPGLGERRKQWKPGWLLVSARGVQWQGPPRFSGPFLIRKGEWGVHTRNVTRDDRLYRSFRVISCSRGPEQYEFGVPKRDVDLCLCALGDRA
jgi:hypothetical protein